MQSRITHSSSENSPQSISKDADNEFMEIILTANEACEKGAFPQAIDLYSEGLRLDPTNAMAYSNRSAAYMQISDFRLALRDAENAIKLQPSWSKGYYRKGMALSHLHHYEDSLVSLARGLAYETQSRQILTAIIDTALKSHLGDSFDATQKQLQKLGLDQNPFVMLSAIGQELLTVGNAKFALSVLQSAEEISTDNLRLKGSLMSALASAHWKLGDQKQAIQYMDEDLSICRSLGDQNGECRAYGNLGNAHFMTQSYPESIQYHKDQLLLATDIKSRKTAAVALGCLGHAYAAIDEHEQALACHEQCLALAVEMGSRVAEAQEYGNLGAVHLAMGEHVKALYYHEQQLALGQELGNIEQQTKAHTNLATVHQYQQDYSQALKCYQELLTLAVKTKSRRAEMRAYAGLGACTRALGDHSTALSYYQQHLSIAMKVADKGAIGKAYCSIGNLNQAMGRLPEALESHKHHLVKVLEQRDRAGEGRVYGNLGNVHCAMGHFNKAVKLHEQALAIAIEVGDTASQASTNGNLGIAYQGLGNSSTALRHLDAHLTISREVGDEEGQLKALANLGNYHAAHGDLESALDLFQEQLELSQVKEDIDSQCKSLQSLSLLYIQQGHISLSANYHVQAISVAATRPALHAKHLTALGRLQIIRGDYSAAIRYLQTAVKSATSHSHLKCGAISLLATACLCAQDSGTALELFNTLSGISAQHKFYNFEMQSLCGLGDVHHYLGHYDKALAYYDSSLTMSRENNNSKEEQRVLVKLAATHCFMRQFEDAHSALQSVRDITPVPEPSKVTGYEERNKLADLNCAFGNLSLAKGDYQDALSHYNQQNNTLLAEEQMWASQSLVTCLYLLGREYEAFALLDKLELRCNEQDIYLKSQLLNLQATLHKISNRYDDAIQCQEIRLDLIRSQHDRQAEVHVLNDLGQVYCTTALYDQSLNCFDQQLTLSQDIDDITGQCGAILGLATVYYANEDHDMSLNMCDQHNDLQQQNVRQQAEVLLMRAQNHLILDNIQESIRYARQAVEASHYYPILLAKSTAYLGQALVKAGDNVGGEETLLSSCSQFEIILLQPSIEFCLSNVTKLQNTSYSLLLSLNPTSIDSLLLYERMLRWDQSRHTPPTSPFPALHTATHLVNKVSSVLQANVCMIVRVSDDSVMTWLVLPDKGLAEQHSNPIQDRVTFMYSDIDSIIDTMFGDVMDDVREVVEQGGWVSVVTSYDVAALPIGHGLRKRFLPDTIVSISGCLNNIAVHSKQKREDRSLVPAFIGSTDILCSVCQAVRGKHYSSLQSPLYLPILHHVVHIDAEKLSFTQVQDKTIFIGDVNVTLLVLHNSCSLSPEEMVKLSLSLLSHVQCIITETVQCPQAILQTFLLQFYKSLHAGSSVFSSINTAWSVDSRLEDNLTIYGIDWLPRQQSMLAGLRLVLQSSVDPAPSLRILLNMLDKVKTGFNRSGPITVQLDDLVDVLGWEEVVRSVGLELVEGTVVSVEDEDNTKLDNLRTLLSALLDCGVCAELSKLFTLNLEDVEHCVELLELYCRTTDAVDSPHLPVLSTVWATAATFLKAVGLCNSGTHSASNTLLYMSDDTHPLCIEATVYCLRVIFDLGSATQPYLTEDDVGAIEI